MQSGVRFIVRKTNLLWFTYQPIGSLIKTLRIVNEEQRRDAWHEYITIDDITWLLDMSMHVIIVMLLCSTDIITNSIIIIHQFFPWLFLNLDFVFKIIIFKFLVRNLNESIFCSIKCKCLHSLIVIMVIM